MCCSFWLNLFSSLCFGIVNFMLATISTMWSSFASFSWKLLSPVWTKINNSLEKVVIGAAICRGSTALKPKCYPRIAAVDVDGGNPQLTKNELQLNTGNLCPKDEFEWFQINEVRLNWFSTGPKIVRGFEIELKWNKNDSFVILLNVLRTS